jgi:homoserine acetyltransferase
VLTQAIPAANHALMESDLGHDGFLLEFDKLAPILTGALN